jgi:hypothetical protein
MNYKKEDSYRAYKASGGIGIFIKIKLSEYSQSVLTILKSILLNYNQKHKFNTRYTRKWSILYYLPNAMITSSTNQLCNNELN